MTPTQIHKDTHRHARTDTLVHRHTNTRTRTRTHKHTRAHTHTHTRTHTHTHAHNKQQTHAQSLPCGIAVCCRKALAVRCNVLQCVAVCCSAGDSRVFYTATHCNSLLPHCISLQHTLSFRNLRLETRDWETPRVLHCVALCCSVLQCVAVCYSVLQRVIVCCSVLQSLPRSIAERPPKTGDCERRATVQAQHSR